MKNCYQEAEGEERPRPGWQSMAIVLVESKHQMASMPAVDANSIRFWISWLSNNVLVEFDAADGRHARGGTPGERGKLGQGQHRKIFN